MAEKMSTPSTSRQKETGEVIPRKGPKNCRRMKFTPLIDPEFKNHPSRQEVPSHLESEDTWSPLVPIMVPAREKNYVPRHGNNFGFYLEDWVAKGELQDYIDRDYGIFEFYIIHFRDLSDHEHEPVFIGSTHMGCYPGTLLECVEIYMENGANKKSLINKALRKGYRIEVRIKNTEFSGDAAALRDESERMQEEMLRTYEYSWNN